MNFFAKHLLKIADILLLIFLFAAGIWCLAAFPIILKLPVWINILFNIFLCGLLVAGFRWKSFHYSALTAELSLIIFFISLTPEEQFKDVTFLRQFEIKPSIIFNPDGTFEVINLRKNVYRTMDDYDRIFVNETYDPVKVQSMELAIVHWAGWDHIAHAMLNFKFSDGKNLAVSVEPRTPENVDRKGFTCMCKQHETLFILSVPEDLFDLRTHHRGEDLFLYQTTFTADECRRFLDWVIARTDKLSREPEFYHLITDNCITSLVPGFKAARPSLKMDLRIFFSGYFARMLFDQNVLVRRERESFESLRSRSFAKGKSQGKL